MYVVYEMCFVRYDEINKLLLLLVSYGMHAFVFQSYVKPITLLSYTIFVIILANIGCEMFGANYNTLK